MATMEHTSTPAVDVPRLLNIAAEYVDAPAAHFGDRVAYRYEGETVTYAELRRRVDLLGHALRDLGVQIEQRVALLLPNCPEFVITFFAAAKIGAVATPISYAVTPEEQALLLADSRARVVVTTDAFWSRLRERHARGDFPFLGTVLKLDGPYRPVEHVLAGVLDETADSLAEAGLPVSLPPAPTTCDDMAFWLHTSGSTGTPKWAVHLHRAMRFAEQLYARPFVGLGPDDVVVCGSPCFHAYPLGFTTYFALAAGATVVLNPERATPARMFQLIREHRATVFVAVPTLYAQMLAAADTDPAPDLSSVRLCLSAAEPLPAEIYRRWRERFGVEILDGIGTTEALHIFISNRAGEVRPGSSGRAVPGYDIRLVDDSGQDVPPGELGNLVVRGGSLFAGYWNRLDATRRVLRGEWYTTGDKYSVDADGYYWYSGRTDDMLRVSGHWVSPAEVEATLATHPDVLEAAVVGHPDADELIKPKAFVVLRPGASPSEALAEQLKSHVKASIAPYSYPRWIEFRAELPKTATGKIQRFKLRHT